MGAYHFFKNSKIAITARAFTRAPTGFLVGVFWRHFEMKKRKQKPQQRRRKPNASQLKRHRNQVLDLTSRGKNRAFVAATVGVGVNRLREDYALELDAGREQARAARADAEADEALTIEEYYFLDAAEASFADNWCAETGGTNLVFRGVDGNGARTAEDAYAGWKARGGKWNCTGLSSKFDPDKTATFSQIASDYRNKFDRR
jgi:hypothetical protein